MKDQIDTLLRKQMDRKDFLKHVGLGLIVLTGLSGVIKFFKPQSTSAGSSYGSSAYGGGKDVSQR